MDIPDELITNNPKEAISYCIANGIEEGILPENFKMSQEGYDILTGTISTIWGKTTDDMVNQIMIAFIAGYATGSRQVEYKGGH